MLRRLILASGSPARQSLLRGAGIRFEAQPVDVDEDGIRHSLVERGFEPKEIADQLAERKSRAAAMAHPDAVVLGCDQVLEFEGQVFSKPKDMEDARRQLGHLNGQEHRLFSAAVICECGSPVWRFTGSAELQMRQSSNEFLDAYVMRNWPGIGDSVGCYRIEEEGVRLFCRVDGDHFTILGLPLVEVLGYLAFREVIPG